MATIKKPTSVAQKISSMKNSKKTTTTIDFNSIDDEVDEASLESFPCSDPPAWIFEKHKNNPKKKPKSTHKDKDK